jgi:nucleoside-diphosphate-sugar epimerase
MQLLVTGATGKVGQTFIRRFLNEPRFAGAGVVALCHNRTLPETARLKVVRGSIAEPGVVAAALDGTTHVVHMATVKEDPVQAMDVSVKGMFLLLDAVRQSPTARQFVLVGGDCVVGHCIVRWDEPVTELSPFRPYPGVYALSKVLEETMLSQFGIQYGLNWTTLRAPWIMEKDDFRYALSFGDGQFGGPGWDEYLTADERRRYHTENRVPLLIASDGRPLRRNFVHVDDLVEAMLVAIDHPAAVHQLFNIAMTEPVDYGVVAEHLERTRGMKPAPIETPLHSNLLDNAKARLQLGWAPRIDTAALVDAAFDYVRAPDDPRKVWYAG